MARKYPLTKTPNAKYVYQSVNKDNQLEYFVRLKPKGTNPFPLVNYTQVFNLYDKSPEEHLELVKEELAYTKKRWEKDSIYYIDEITGKLEKQKKQEEKKLQEEEQRKIEAEEEKKINSLFNTVFEKNLEKKLGKNKFTEQTLKSYLHNYRKHIKPHIGGTSVYDLKYDDLYGIFTRMSDKNKNGTGIHVYHKKTVDLENTKPIMKNEKKSLSLATKKNVLTILRNVFKHLVQDDNEFSDFYFNPVERLSKEIIDDFNSSEEVKYPSLDIRLKGASREDMINIVRKIYQEIQTFNKQHLRVNGQPKKRESGEYKSKVYFLTSLMTARRHSELTRIKHLQIEKDKEFVIVEAKQTKTKVDEAYPIPPEAMEIINSHDDEYPFKVAYGTANRQWRRIKKAIDMDDYEFRQYDFRHLFVTIMSKDYDRHMLGLCLSHSSGDKNKSNDRYFALPHDVKKEIFEKYWEILREPNDSD